MIVVPKRYDSVQLQSLQLYIERDCGNSEINLERQFLIKFYLNIVEVYLLIQIITCNKTTLKENIDFNVVQMHKYIELRPCFN